tara:strand:+ start:4476 stop:4736 length:261 start_codon:yes stop_codon:yes gene_type:complete
MNIIHEKCNLSEVDNTDLPRNSYVVTYSHEEKEYYDIVVAMSTVDIFDHYYDNYKAGLKTIGYTKGTVNSKLWKSQQASKPKRPKK